MQSRTSWLTWTPAPQVALPSDRTCACGGTAAGTATAPSAVIKPYPSTIQSSAPLRPRRTLIVNIFLSSFSSLTRQELGAKGAHGNGAPVLADVVQHLQVEQLVQLEEGSRRRDPVGQGRPPDKQGAYCTLYTTTNTQQEGEGETAGELSQ